MVSNASPSRRAGGAQDPASAGFGSGLRPAVIDPVVGRCLGGKLIVEERIGAGALGTVYRAKHVLLPQPVAVKVLHPHHQDDPTYRARFLAEAQAASLLDHPSLVRVIDFGEQWGGFMWLAMDLVEGTSLETVLADEQRLEVRRAAEIVLDVCAGLAHAHAQGIVHGDVKPANVYLVARPDDDGDVMLRAKLCDFGVARVGRPNGNVVESGTLPALGTPAYMSPEQCLGEDLDATSDVYSCGVIFYELITGEVPFSATDPHLLLQQHLLRTPTPPSLKCADIDPRVDAIVRKALAKERRERFASMRALRAALRELIGPSEPYVVATESGVPASPSILHPAQPSEHAALVASAAGNSRVPAPPRAEAELPPLAVRPSQTFRPARHKHVTSSEETEKAVVGAYARPVSDARPVSGAKKSDFEPRTPSHDGDAAGASIALLEREKQALAELLDHGLADAVASRVAGLLARLESSRGRDTIAAETLRLLDEPGRLEPFGECLLSEDVLPGPYIERMLERCGQRCARALWAARVSPTPASPQRRGRFVAWMLAIGPSAVDVLRVGLAKLSPHAATWRHADLVEDVLLALPSRCDDELLAVVAYFAKSPVPRVRELALAAIARALR
ncbi:MAG TPA: protein kinase [Labilithrix sp.]|nr:protein kinase [Labilithrix sp.]